jgi:tripeptide aminopeptidase
MNLKIDKEDLVNRFMKYVAIDTQSDAKSESSPSTEKQKDLSRILHQELQDLGIEAEIDAFGQVYATSCLPIRIKKCRPLPFLRMSIRRRIAAARMSSRSAIATSMASRSSCRMIQHKYLNIENSPFLKDHIGKDIITASGTTLLGADDKAGVASVDVGHHLFETKSRKSARRYTRYIHDR